MSKRLRLTDGFHRAVDEDSSSGCSSSGPAGMRNYIPSPVSPNAGVPMFAVGRKSPLNSTAAGAAEKTPARYLPYTIRPLVLRAKRKLQSESNSLATSTARRIMTALDRSATPVVDSVKVHYDPVVASRPVFTPLRRNNLGPPILKSPMVPAPTLKVVYNPSMHIHIPKLVDFGTNTDLTMGTITTLDALRSNISIDECNGTPHGMFKYSPRGGEECGGGKMKSFSTRLHTPSLRPKSTVVENKSFAVSKPESKFKFSKAWSSEELNSKLSISKFDFAKEDKPSIDSTMCSKCREEIVPAHSLAGPAKTVFTESVSAIQKPKEDAAAKQWECPVCMVRNKPEQHNCPCCGEKKPNASVTLPSESVKPVVTACTELSTSWSNAKSAQPVQSGKNWDCPTCMVPNKSDAAACVCCSEKNPNAASLPVSSSAPSTTAASGFKFGFSTAPSQPADNKFESTKDTSIKSTFIFGSQPESSNTASSSPPKSNFKFGDTSKAALTEAPAISSTPKNLTIGTSTTSPAFGATTSPAFGTTATPAFGTNAIPAFGTTAIPAFGTTTSSAFGTTASSAFGTTASPAVGTTASPAVGTTASPAFVTSASPAFGATTSPAFGLAGSSSITSTTLPRTTGSATCSEMGKPQLLSSFSFGSPAASVPFVKTSDQWDCEQCPAKSLTSNACVGCGSSKPKERTQSSQGSSSKRFHFEPFSGGRAELKTQDSVDARGEPELKRKMPSSSSGSSLSFAYNPPTEVTLKMKNPEPPMFGGSVAKAPASGGSAFSPQKDAASPKSGNFLDALKTGQQFSFQTPAPGTSVIPSAPGGLIAVSPAQSSTFGSTSNNGFSSSLVSSTTGPPAGLFQMGAPSNLPVTTSFGQSSAAPTSNPATSISSSTSGFNILGNNSVKPGGFSFGAGTGGLSNGPSASTLQTQPPVFGSSASSGGPSSIFGINQHPIQQPGLGLNAGSGGQSGALQLPGNPLSNQSASTPQFNVTAPPSTFNFGIPQPGAFAFTAQPSPAGSASDSGGRKIRKATRRMK